MTESKHAQYSPSSSHRWLNCSAYQKFLKTLPEQLKHNFQTNEAAREGSAAHRLAELCFRLEHKPELYLNKAVVLDDGTDFTINQEIVDGVNIYLNYIYGLINDSPEVQDYGFEQKVEIPHPTQKLFGTCDFYIDYAYEGFEIVDFKFGRQDVSPEDNSQLLFYVVGAMHSLGVMGKLRPEGYKVKLTIVQPRSLTDPQAIKTWETDLDYLDQFQTKILKGIDTCCSSKLVFSVGSWCRYCPAAHLCPVLSSKIYETTKALIKTDDIVIPCATDLTPVELVKTLDFIDVIKGWIKDVESHAEQQLKQGKAIEGYKLVAKKGYRKWKDEENTKKVLTTLGDKLYSERKIISPAQAEKLGVDKEVVSQLTSRLSSGTKLAKVSDKQPEAKRPPTVLEAFNVIK